MKSDIHQSVQRLFSVDSYADRGITLIRGDGVYLYDVNGVQYLDCMSNYGVNIFGYNHPEITQGLVTQVTRLITLHGSFNNDVRASAVKKLVKRCGGGLKKVYFSNSGSEAVEAALKYAVLATNKKKFVVASHGYHGKTLGALSATQGEKYKQAFYPLLWEFIPVDFDDLAALVSHVSEDVAAVLLEPIQGEGGINPPNDNYLKKVRQLCDQRGILLILDEVQTGCGRTGTFLSSQANAIDYDIVCLGKGLAGGLPIGATLVNSQVASSIPKQIHTSTFGGNPLSCAGVVSTLDLLDDALLNHIKDIGGYFLEQLAQLTSKRITAVRGRGLMIGVEVNDNRDDILRQLQKQQILAIPAGEKVVRFLPPYIIEREHVDRVVEVLDQILQD